MDVNSWGEEADDWGDGADDWGEGADDWGDDADDWDEADAGKTVAGEGLACQNDSIIAAVAVDRMTNVSNSFDSTPAVSNDVQHLMQNFSSQVIYFFFFISRLSYFTGVHDFSFLFFFFN